MADKHWKLRAQVRAGRELLGLKQKDVAQEMNIPAVTISRSESGETKSLEQLNDIRSHLEKRGVRFTKDGVEFSHDQIEIIEGKSTNNYLRLLDDVAYTLRDEDEKNLYIMCSTDSVSPPEVNDRYRYLRKQGIKMHQIIEETDTYLMGPLEEYRTIQHEYFTNVVTLIYKNKVAQVNGDGTRITVRTDNQVARRERQIFQLLWNSGDMPSLSTAEEKY